MKQTKGGQRYRLRSARYEQLVQAAEAAGWGVRFAGNGHMLLVPPQGGKPVSISLTMEDKDNRVFLNARAALRRGGVSV